MLKNLLLLSSLILAGAALASVDSDNLLVEKVSLEKTFAELLQEGASPDSKEVREIQSHIDNINEEINSSPNKVVVLLQSKDS